MKTIGLLGGMSCESTIEYYRIINQEVRKRLGKNNSAKILLHSFNFQEIVDLQFKSEWDKLGELLAENAMKLEKDGADCILICTNLMHKVAPAIQEKISIPLIHMCDSVANEIKKQNIDTVGLLGTIFTMGEHFYKDRIKDHDIKVLTPQAKDAGVVSDIIYQELCRGILTDESKETYLKVIGELKEKGAKGVILGCTEIPLLIQQQDTDLHVFNTTQIHALSAAEFALS